MGTRRETMATILSAVTGLRRDHLEEYDTLRALLKKADRPGKEQQFYDFGLIRFRWPQSRTKKGTLVLDVRFFEPDKYTEVRRLENSSWRGVRRPEASFAGMAQFPIRG